jgi:hypothetical protein
VGRDRGVQNGVGHDLGDQQARELGLTRVHPPVGKRLGGELAGLGHHDRLGGEDPLNVGQVDRGRGERQNGHVVVDIAWHRVFGGGGDTGRVA